MLKPRGEEYDAENIGERLLGARLPERGARQRHRHGRPEAYGPKDKQRFANTLDRALYRLRGGAEGLTLLAE